MKITILLSLVALSGVFLLHTAAISPKGKDAKMIEKTVERFVKAGDQQDVAALEALLHDSYRIIWNDTQAGEVKNLDRSTYLQLIGAKKFGGDKRTIRIDQLELNGEITATVQVYLDGEQADFHSFLSLVKDQGDWKLVQDLVFMQ